MTSQPYSPAFWCRSGHVNTLYSGLLRAVEVPAYRRQRVETPDGDFLDGDWLRDGNPRLAIISHGLEGNSHRVYVSGMALTLARAGWDVLAWNYRGCSGEANRKVISYHSGFTDDLDWIVQRSSSHYQKIALIGFSLGGNITAKYLGEKGTDTPVFRAAVLSVPCDLAGSSNALTHWSARPYMARFLTSLREKVRTKAKVFPDQVPLDGLDEMTTFAEFDNAYTAPINGFRDAEDYWAQASCKQYLPAIKIPTLMVNAQDDPFLSPSCFPHEEAAANPHLSLLTPRWGGHVGFAEGYGRFWSERAVPDFLAK
ncbi:MAG: putative alpha/beta-fold hydrolase [Rhodothermales bacterium]